MRAQQIHKGLCALVLKVKYSNKSEVHVLLFKVKTADEAMKIKYFYERDVDVTKLVVPIKIKQRGKESVFCCNINIPAEPDKTRRC